MIDHAFNEQINKMINRLKTRQAIFTTLYCVRGCGKIYYRNKLFELAIKEIQENEKSRNEKINVRWVNYNECIKRNNDT